MEWLLLSLIASNPSQVFAPPCQQCFVLLYPDRDSSSQFKDYRCGNLTYDGHKGTDFAIADEQKMREGVPVLAAAAGRVLRVRDGLIDRKTLDPATVKGQECGNGLVIDHGMEWQSQYCHLRQGSVRVRPGDRVKQGTPVGLIGQSGLASFPHVHLQVTFRGKIIDPAVGLPQTASCQQTGSTLWQPLIPYVPTGLIHAGFSSQVPTMEEIEQGKWSTPVLTTHGPSIVFWTRSYGVQQGDRIKIQLFDPDQKKVIDQQQTLVKNNRILLLYAGKANRQKAKAGKWLGKFQLMRGQKVLIDHVQPLTIKMSDSTP